MESSAGWNFADVWETIAEVRPDALALVHGDRRLSWDDFDRRADGVAQALLASGVVQQDKVAEYMYNGPEYLETVFGCAKAGLVPVNTNYRYGDEELAYLWSNADAVAVVFHGTFAERIEGLRSKGRVPGVRTWLWVDDSSGPCPSWAVPYEDAADSGEVGRRRAGPWGRSGDDLYFLYTGGTTGMPKGVMWRQDDLYVVFSESTMHDPEVPDFGAVRARLEQMPAGQPGPSIIPACPLMHGTGAFTALQWLFLGGSVVTLTSRRFDVIELFDTVEREGVNTIAIVGDAFARPMVEALDAEPGRWDLSSLALIVSSGVMWSEPVKTALLRHQPAMLLIDTFSSSEAMMMGQSISGSGGTRRTAMFNLGEKTRLIDDDGAQIEPGSDRVGRVAVQTRCPVGYYKDPEKSARTFLDLDGDGRRWSVPGDFATVDAEGRLHLLGRGSVCINTGGEKVFPEEVEEALKEHPDVADAVVVGVPDERFGEVICAWVEPLDGAGGGRGAQLEEAALIAHVKERLAGYKAPRRVLSRPSIGRSPAGKVDYALLRQEAISRVAPG
ncbi:MAG: AMP-binding protein [Acidimicrobiales bacterium]